MAENIESKKFGEIRNIKKDTDYYFISYKGGEQAKLFILNDHVFRYHMSITGEFPDYPIPDNPEATAFIAIKSNAEYGTDAFKKSYLIQKLKEIVIETNDIQIVFHKKNGTMTVTDRRTNKYVFVENNTIQYDHETVTQTVTQNEDEYFFGGGMQNGRFTHKGEIIKIINNNTWDDGGVTSPCPFYWSTRGYGVLRNTWGPGYYDFGRESKATIKTTHYSTDFDAFYFINSTPKDLLSDYYELTGQPIFMPEYAFYQAHLNTFNRDYWVKVQPEEKGAILFEDGFYYKCYQPAQMTDKEGVLESLNGEKNNYQFSARAMIDRYRRHDMPLGWFVPNDGYGSGYGQTDSLDGDIENLKLFGDYARKNGVELAVWTESNLHPVDPEHPKKGDRDLNKEVSVAGVMSLKADVAWIGSGYSFGLSAMQNAADTFIKAAKKFTRPMIIAVDGWAGTQRCAGIWSGDQSGGEWEYIRFHIPTYIGSGLSGQPNIGSDLDGIFRGGDRKVNIRDFQWKAFTPIQLNMDGWGWIQKTPFSFDDEATSINRAYLKLKSMLMPYAYTLGFEATRGLPMIRAMFLEFPEDLQSYTKDSQYQYFWGPNILVAPIYNEEENCDGASIRHGIYLPSTKQLWIDLLTGERYLGGQIINDYICPLWKIPIFIRDGAIIPICNPNNHPNEIKRDHRTFLIYPNNDSKFNLYEDDGISMNYLENQYSITEVKVHGPAQQIVGKVDIKISKTEGDFEGMINEKSTELIISLSKDISEIKIALNQIPIDLTKANSKDDYKSKDNVYYFDRNFIINSYFKGLTNEPLDQKFLLIKLAKQNVYETEVHIQIDGYLQDTNVLISKKDLNKDLEIPSGLVAPNELIQSDTIGLTWNKLENIVGYEIEKNENEILIRTLNNKAVFEHLTYSTNYIFRVRAVADNGVSEWSEILSVTTKDDPYINVIENVDATCSLPCQKGQDINNILKCDFTNLWHTYWNEEGQMDNKNKQLKINFDFGQVENVDKFEYIPRNDAGNGTLLRIKYKYSADGFKWSEYSDTIAWEEDSSTKSVNLNGVKIRYFEIFVLKSVGNFGSGRAFLFYKEK